MKKELMKIIAMIILLGILIYGIVWINKDQVEINGNEETLIVEEIDDNKK